MSGYALNTSAMRAFARIAAVLVCTLALSACVVETATYLSQPGDHDIDARLFGAWTVPDDNENRFGFIAVQPDSDGTAKLLSLEVSQEDNDTGQSFDWNTARMWTTEIDGASYINFTSEEDNMVLAYRMRGDDEIEIGIMQTKLWRTAIEDGRLDGKVESGTFGADVTVTAPREQLRAFLRDNGGHALFEFGSGDEAFVLHRYRFSLPQAEDRAAQ